MSNLDQIISLNITKFPLNLLIPDEANQITIQAINNSNNSENFIFVFKGENLKVLHGLNEIQNQIEFNSKEIKNLDIKLVPLIDGFGKLSINVYWLKIQEYLVKEQKIRENIKKSRINEILERHEKFLIENVEVQNQDELLMDMSSNDINQTLQNFKIIEKKPLKNINIEILKFIYLFNLAKRYIKDQKKSESLTLINLIISNILSFINKKHENKKIKKNSYNILLDAIYTIAEIDNLKSANSIIESINTQDLKKKVIKDLFDDFYIIVEEVRIKTENNLIFSQLYSFNTYVSKVSNEIKNFSLIGGNLSNNLLMKDLNYKIIFLSLFSFNFSIFPIIDRLYNDLKNNENKPFAYYIFPSMKNYDENEYKSLKNTLTHFFKNLVNPPHQTYIFNMDFIPYLGKPTIILSSDYDINDLFSSKIKKMGDLVNLIIDDRVFKSGKIYEDLKQIYPSNKIKIINLVLSYEFINDYDLFKKFVQSLF